jgi:pseudouridine-5'-phosphate glycosidase
MAKKVWQARGVLVIHPKVQEALAERKAVVALESTIIAHGLPYPANLKLAKELQQTVREAGATPATIAVVGGRARIGLSDGDLELLADPSRSFAKAGAADLAVAMAREQDAATTVSATALLAVRAGIRLFATGGIGGVHRGDASDVSADLGAIARLPIGVVSAGPKAILDLHRTSETLETLGVLVLGFSCSELPAFYSRTSGIDLEHRVDTAGDAAAILRVRWGELAEGGVLIANPVPESFAMAPAEVERLILLAHGEADEQGVTGKALTPFLLAAIAREGGSKVVEANAALAKNNARLAAEIAISLCEIE